MTLAPARNPRRAPRQTSTRMRQRSGATAPRTRSARTRATRAAYRGWAASRRLAATPWTRPTLNATPPSHRPAGPRRAPFVLLMAGLLVGGLCLLLALNTASAAAELRRQRLLDSNASLKAAVQQARSQLAASEAPGALGAAASKLGMVANGSPGYLTVHRDGTVTVLGRPAPATAAPPPAPPTKPIARTTAVAMKRASATRPTPRPKPTSKPTAAPTSTAPLPGGAR
jgi:hypothetical protein